MELETGEHHASGKNGHVIARILSSLLASTRETDVIGWYKAHTTVGVMFTGVIIDDKSSILTTMLMRVTSILQNRLTFEQFNKISISFHFYPDRWDEDTFQRPGNPALYPDLSKRETAKKASLWVKRVMDLVCGAMLLVIFAPVFLIIAFAVKTTSKGPVWFRQRRIGQYGKPFMFFKFRSMYINNDSAVHETYVKRLIAGQTGCHLGERGENGAAVYKLTNDSRVTRVGKLLRRTSLDELPQVFNVLRGEMSLVGPRPPIPYELAAYQTWHRRRVLEVKPGITGLWQVNGRSRVKFDEMVRFDLRYANTWSPWLDLKILLSTPRAVWQGDGAY
jgi:exopolysaccharide biosynthesis polyprenyl glycosylphosphotransferase